MNHTGMLRQLFTVVLLSAVTALPARGQNPTEGTPLLTREFPFKVKNASVEHLVLMLAMHTGLEVDISGIDGTKTITASIDKADFWKVVDVLAAQTGSQVVIGQQGKAVRLVKLAKGVRIPVSSDGPFRIAARDIDARHDLITGKTSYDLTLEIAWEARLPVYRIDAVPRLTKGEDDAGRAITVKPLETRNPVDGVSTTVRIRLDGLTRTSKEIAVLQGSFRATAAEEVLRVAFDDLTKPATLKQHDVEVLLRKTAKEGTFWLVDLEMKYPKESAIFESFETYWVGRNRIALVAPDGTTKFTTDDMEINANAVRYRFKEDKAKGFAPLNLKGWKLEYEAPGVLREVPVRFELKGIGLP